MFRKLFTILGTVGIFVGGFMLIAVMGSLRPKIEPKDPVITPPSVFYVTAQAEPVTLDVAAQGEVRPRTDINLTAQVSGQIVSISNAFVDGGAFKKGDVLIKIEDAPYRAAAAAARSALAQEEAESTLARKDYEDLGSDKDPTALALRLPQLEQKKAEYKSAELNLDRTTIRAPFNGRVRERIVGLGQYVSPGMQLGRIFSTDVAEVRLPLSDNDLAKLGLPLAFVATKDHPGPHVTLRATVAGEPHEWDARIARTDGAIEATTRQIGAIAVVEDPYGKGADDGAPLAMGLYVDAVIEGKPFDHAYILPRSALYGRDEIYVVRADDTLEKRTVKIVSDGRDTITVIDGVEDGERVVSSPLRGASEGDKVVPTDPTQLPDAVGEPDDEPDPTKLGEANTADSGEGL